MVPGAYFGRGYIGALGDDLRIIVDSLPYLLCLIVALMCLLFQRGRLLLAALSVAAFYWVVQSHLQISLTSSTDALNAYLALSFSLPVLALYLLLLPERGIWNLRSNFLEQANRGGRRFNSLESESYTHNIFFKGGQE